jgi:hypothetical protein
LIRAAASTQPVGVSLEKGSYAKNNPVESGDYLEHAGCFWQSMANHQVFGPAIQTLMRN